MRKRGEGKKREGLDLTNPSISPLGGRKRKGFSSFTNPARGGGFLFSFQRKKEEGK